VSWRDSCLVIAVVAVASGLTYASFAVIDDSAAEIRTTLASELEALPICHSRIVREAPSLRLQRLAEMTTHPSN
jgi:hypothetical protein